MSKNFLLVHILFNKPSLEYTIIKNVMLRHCSVRSKIEEI